MPNVCLGYVHRDDVSHSWSESLAQLIVADIAEGVTVGEIIKIHGATGMLDESRNILVKEFLSRSDFDWLFLLDDDMGFKPDTLKRLLEAADPKERPVMGALCFMWKELEFDGYQGYRCSAMPTIMEKTWQNSPEWGDQEVYRARGWYPPASIVKCDATGMACTLIHRSALEKIGGGWFDRYKNADESRMGEDISFCKRAAEHDIPIHVHTGVKTTHHKSIWVSDEEFWQERLPDPAVDPTLVIVPVLHRPANAAPFMRSLRATTGLTDVVAVADEDDMMTRQAWKEAGAVILAGPEHTFAEKVNRAYRTMYHDIGQLTHPWMFITGDDVRFHPGWLDHAQWCAAMAEAAVVGTNDLGNPRVTSGEHGTHLLIAKPYVDDYGASWDGPKVVCHEGYHHWCVDDEIVTAAKQRGVWTSALGSIVEHFHPYFGKGSTDGTYREGEAEREADLALFRQRLAENSP